jgi:hypothetical protein
LRRLFCLIALLGFGVAGANAQQPYLDPTLRVLLQPETRAAVETTLREGFLEREAASRAGLLALDTDGPMGEARVGVFVRLRSPAALAELRAVGAEIGTVAGDIATARVPLSALPRLEAITTLERV